MIINTRGNYMRAIDSAIDITENNVSEERFQSLTESSTDWIWEVDINGVYTYSSLKIKDLLGYEIDEILGKSLFDHKTPDEVDKAKQFFNKCSLEKKQFTQIESKNLHKNGSVVILETSGIPYFDSDGIFCGYRGIDRDITNQKNTEKILRENERRYKNLFENSNIGIYQTTPDGQILMANPYLYKMLGYSSFEEIKNILAMNIQYANTDLSREKFNEILQKEGKIESLEVDLKRPDGTVISVIENANVVVDDSGKVLYYEGMFEDITKRKADEKLRNILFEITNSLITTSDMKGLFDAIRIHLNGVLDTTNLMIATYEKETDSLYLPYMIDEKDDLINHIPCKGSMAELVIRDAKPVFMKRKDIENRYRELGRDPVGSMPEVWVGVPLILGGEVIGVIIVQHYTNGLVYNESHLEILKLVSGQIALLIDGKNREEQLRRSETKYRTLYENSPTGIYRATPDGEFIFANPAMLRMFDCNTFEELKQYNKENVIKYIDDSMNRKKFREILEKEGKVKLLEAAIQKPNGSVIYLNENAQAVWESDGVMEYYEGTVENITEKKKSEQIQFIQHEITLAAMTSRNITELCDQIKAHIGKIINTSNLLITLYDEETDSLIFPYMVDEKDDFKKSPRRTSLSDYVIRDAKSLLIKEKELAERMLEDGKVLQGSMPKVWLGIPLIVNNKVIGTFVLQSYDNENLYGAEDKKILDLLSPQISLAIDRKIAEDKKTKLLKELKSANKELNEFAYIVSHDLKAPLRGIGSLINWLVADYKEKIDDEGKNMLELLHNRAERMNALIDGILNYSRIGRIREVVENVNLKDTLEDVIELLSPPSNIKVTLDNEFPTILCEKTRITQVFQNLIGNAIKYNDKPEGKINVGNEKENGFWKFWVKDNGPGIEEKYYQKVFQIFQTLKSRDEVEGTGIGLTLVQKIIETYGGKIWLESKVNEGTTFYFTLPEETDKK